MWNAQLKRGKIASAHVALAGIAASIVITLAGAVVATPGASATFSSTGPSCEWRFAVPMG